MTTIRVTVGDSGAGFDLPELSEAQVEALRSLRDAPTALWAVHLSDAEMDECFVEELAMFEDELDARITKLGRAILAHYEAQR